MRLGLVLLLAGVAAAQPASDLLQSGIFHQETSGDLAAAIGIFRQILSAGPAQRLYAGQAQFRLGQCLLRKGDKQAARAAFSAVIRDYPGDRELVARAKENLPGRNDILPPPWRQRELAEYSWTVPGVEDAWSVSYAGAKRIETHFFTPTMKTSYLEPDSLIAEGGFPFLLRRMLLAPDWQGSFEWGGRKASAVMEGEEDVSVPAGRYHCYRVHLTAPSQQMSLLGAEWRVPAAGETVWIATSGSREVVKMLSGSATGELTGVRTADPSGQTVLRDPAFGYSIAVPGNWLSHTRVSADRRQATIDLRDVESSLQIRILVESMTPLNRTLANRMAIIRNQEHDYHMRGEVQRKAVEGHETATWTADFKSSRGQENTEVVRQVQGQSTAATLRAQMPAKEFERLRARFEPVIESFRLR